MDAAATLVNSLPEQAERIRHLYWRDPAFRTLCVDFHDASQMLARLEQSVPPDLVRMAEYQDLLAEIFSEVVEILEREKKHGARNT